MWVHVFAASLSRELCGMPGLERRVRAPSITLNTGIAPSRISKNSGTFDELSKKKKKNLFSLRMAGALRRTLNFVSSAGLGV